MTSVDTSVQPPGLDEVDEPDGEPTVQAYASLIEADGTHRSAYVHILGHGSDDQLADALLACLRGCAAVRGPGLVAAVERRLR